MARSFVCPECGDSERLKGSQSPEGIRIRCDACGHEWLRDSEPERCATCGGTDLVRRRQALTQYSRGTQLSIVGMGEIMLCHACDAEMVEWSGNSRAVPFSYRSCAEQAGGSGDDAGDVRITP
jgi:rubredoxin